MATTERPTKRAKTDGAEPAAAAAAPPTGPRTQEEYLARVRNEDFRKISLKYHVDADPEETEALHKFFAEDDAVRPVEVGIPEGAWPLGWADTGVQGAFHVVPSRMVLATPGGPPLKPGPPGFRPLTSEEMVARPPMQLHIAEGSLVVWLNTTPHGNCAPYGPVDLPHFPRHHIEVYGPMATPGLLNDRLIRYGAVVITGLIPDAELDVWKDNLISDLKRAAPPGATDLNPPGAKSCLIVGGGGFGLPLTDHAQRVRTDKRIRKVFGAIHGIADDRLALSIDGFSSQVDHFDGKHIINRYCAFIAWAPAKIMPREEERKKLDHLKAAMSDDPAVRLKGRRAMNHNVIRYSVKPGPNHMGNPKDPAKRWTVLMDDPILPRTFDAVRIFY